MLVSLGDVLYNGAMIEAVLAWITHMVEVLGYPGIFIEALLESTFVPLAVEVTMVPAGFLVYQGKMDAALVLTLAILGTVTGSLLNYAIARSCGRYLLVRYGKYMFMNEHKLAWIENYFRQARADLDLPRPHGVRRAPRHFVPGGTGAHEHRQVRSVYRRSAAASGWRCCCISVT